MNDLNLLHIFYTVAKCESISKAAEKLYISQPAVSQNIKNLEDDIGVTLFFRKSKGVSLTTEGEEIFSRLKKVFKEVDLLNQEIDNLKNMDSGILRIGASDTICKYYLIDKLKIFEQKFPRIRYRVTNCTTDVSLKLLKDNDVDIAFVHAPIKNKDFTFFKCLELEDVFVCSKDFDDSKIKCLQDIASYRILLLEGTSHSRKMLDQCLEKYNVILKPKFELASLDLLIEFCKKNMGIICVSKQYIERELQTKELKIINIKEKLDKRYISLAINNNFLGTPAKRFIEEIHPLD